MLAANCRRLQEAVAKKLEDKSEDGTTVTVKTYAPKEGGAEVVLIEIEGGGHTWPGVEPPVQYIGKSTKDVSANDMICEFLQRNRLP